MAQDTVKAAALDMYMALKQIIEDYNDQNRRQVTQASINRAVKAIDKAEGR